MPGVFLWGYEPTTEKWAPVKVDAEGNVYITTAEMAIDKGTATGGSNTTLVDNTKSWETNIWADAILQVKIGGIEYHRTILSNTADTITINALPGGVAVSAGCEYSIRRVVSPLIPLDKANEHNTAELANTDILASALSPTNTPCLFRVMVAFDTTGTFRVTITSGGNTQTVIFNNNVNLTVNCLYMFDHLVHSGDTINYQYSVNAQLIVLRVQEIVAGTQ